LSYTFNLKLNSPQWNFLASQFLEAYNLKNKIGVTPLRTQNRNIKPEPVNYHNAFTNEPDTDLDLPQNRQWALDVLQKWSTTVNEKNFTIPVQVGEKHTGSNYKKLYRDRSRNGSVTFCEANLATFDQVKKVIAIAEKDAPEWRKVPLDKRTDILYRVADNLAAKRGDLIGCMAAITGKTFSEGDVEVSEAIDFCRYYPHTMKQFEQLQTLSYKPKGIVLVIPPWNFPLAIPVGGVAAALSGGNTVILKPATVALPVAWEFARCFWEAGVPKDALQVVCPAQRDSLNHLTAHPSIKHVILTGGTDTAFRLLENSPRTPLSAETGGKNAIIVTAHADQDHAILNIVSSAFSNAGQKCSACSLLLLDKKTYNDEIFQAKLKDAVTSIRTGSVWDTMNVVGPMIDNSNEKLKQAIERLEPGESWLVAPEFVDDRQYILKPSVKWGVKPGSYTFQNELFAPLLSVVCIDDLEQGIAYANSSEYGLTAGLQSLNEKEQAQWKNSIEAGNLYINRGITGAIVNRQPFGGMKRSAFGGGIKAGGPNYVANFIEVTENPVSRAEPTTSLSNFIQDKSERNRVNFAWTSYQKAWKNEFSQEKDICPLYGEKNSFRYLPLKNMGFRVLEKDNPAGILLVMIAAHTCGTSLTVSLSPENSSLEVIEKARASLSGVRIKLQSEQAFIDEMDAYERIRTCSSCLPDAFYRKAAVLGKYIADRKPLVEGRLELLHYLKEQSIAHEYHRYGSIFEGK
jgi:RHH-type proline utilization regulon transcriptional repressor/proline dehydrogenase/delta 1-pyrroline-5-carboxylate dehydrogenase